MNIAQRSQILLFKLWRESHQGGPQAAMHVGDLSVDQTAHQHIAAVSHRARQSKNQLSLWVPPPAAFDHRAGDRIRKTWRLTARGLQDDAVISNKLNGLFSRPHNVCYFGIRTIEVAPVGNPLPE